MIFLDQMKNMKIYKRPMFLPTLENDKKKHSAILLLTPNYESSKRLMNHPLTVNRLRYQSYYMERDVSYYINGKVSKNIEVEEYAIDVTSYQFYTSLCEMSSAERNKLPDSTFGLPDKRKYPLDSAKHVKSAIRFFNYVDPKDEEELARNIKKAIKKHNVTITGVGEKNRFSKYYSVKEEAFTEAVEELDVSDSDSYILSNFIHFNGYYSDLVSSMPIVTPSLYKQCIKAANIEVRSADDLPQLDIFFTNGDVATSMMPREETKCISIYVMKRSAFEGSDIDYAIYVKDIIVKAMSYWNTAHESWGKDQVYRRDTVENIDLNTETDACIESYIFNEATFKIHEDSLQMGDIITFINEAGNYDQQLRRLLFAERMKQRKQVVEKLNEVKNDNKWIKYAFPEMNRLQAKNVFVDLYYYNELFFKNNVWKLKKGYELYLALLDRLINDPRLKANGYNKKTLFIPIKDWDIDRATRMWMYRESINPVSIIFELMKVDNARLKSVFGDTILVFFDNNRFFKLDFSELEDIPKASQRFMKFVKLFRTGQAEDDEDIDTEFDHKETPEAIKANIVDQIELSKGVDLTAKVAAVKAEDKKVGNELSKKVPKKAKEDVVMYTKSNNVQLAKDKSLPEKQTEELNDEKVLTKSADLEKIKQMESDLDKLADSINNAAEYVNSTEDAYEFLNNDEDFKAMLIDIEADDGGVKMDAGRAARMNKLNDDLLKSTVKGKTVKELLEPNPVDKQIETTALNIASPNPEWKEMKYMNFDKSYDLNKDIVNCIYHFTKVSKPVAIRNLKVEDHSTSEDRLDLYTIEMEDFRGKRFTVKMDIPKMKDNRFILRGNTKSLQTQFFNMPIIKTNLDTCQIISNYQKVFIYRVNTNTGRSLPSTSRFIKALEKYTGKTVKVTTGDNTRICNKYELPIDYIDLASVYSIIETPSYKWYFDPEKIRKDYPNVDDSKGVPMGINKKEGTIEYYIAEKGYTVVDMIFNHDEHFYKEVFKIYEEMKPATSGTYSRCNILNEKIPMVVILGYLEGLSAVLSKAKINYELKEKITNEERHDLSKDLIRFKDGYLIYGMNYSSCMLLNGLKECDTTAFSFTDIDNKSMWLEFLDNYGGRSRSDGLDNFYDCLIDPMTEETLKYYKLPTDFVEMFLYANNLLCDNKFVKHTDTSTRRIRRTELVAAYTYEALSEAYAAYAIGIKHNRAGAEFAMKQTAVIDKILLSPISSDDSVINALYAVENTNAVTYKGKAGLNDDRSYSLDKRIYDDSMLNVIGMSTNFSASVGITRQATLNMNVEGERGYIKSINSDVSKMNAANTLCATEALTPFGSTRDDSDRTYMTFIQTAKHSMRTEESDPLLITNGADEAMPYLTIDKFAFKAKQDGTIKEVNDDFMIVEYKDGNKDYINLKETVEKNSDAGFYVPLKLNKMKGLSAGKKIKAGDILAYDPTSFSNSVGESDNIAYNIGKLCKVGIINTDDGFEDSGICTERLSKALSTRIIRKVDHVIDKEAIVYNIKKVGDPVEVEDPLIIWQDPHEDEEANTLMRVMNADQSEISEFGRKSIRSEVSGKIVDIKIYRTVEMNELSPSLQKIVKAYEAPIKELQKKLKEENIEGEYLPATYKLEPTGKLKRAQEAILIEFYLEYVDSVAIGDKIVYFAANKATIKNIIPKENTPYTDFRPNEPIDAFISQISIDKRLVNSIPINGAINKLLIEMDRNIRDILGIKYDDTKV